MRAGMLRQRVTIQESTPTQNEVGEEIDNWSDVATVWASILPKSSVERFLSGAVQVQAEITHGVRIRYRGDLTPMMRIVWENRYLYIETIVDPDGRGFESVVLCKEVQAEVPE